MAGAQLDDVPSLDPSRRALVRDAIVEGFVFAFRGVVIGAAALALTGAVFGVSVRSGR
jgi:hypothetical protein